MNDCIQTLKEMGLHQKEAEIYLVLLNIGTNPASTIAKKTKQNRSTCYGTIEKLIQRGFVQQIIKNNINYFTAVEPKYILHKIKTQHYRLEEKFEDLDQILLQYQSAKKYSKNKSKVFFYEGEEGIKNIMEDTLTTKDTIRAYASFDELIKVLPHYFAEYKRKRIKKGIFVKAIYPTTAKSIKHQKYDKTDLRKSKLISKEYDFSLDILVYDHKLTITSLKEKFAIVINNEAIAEAQKKIFDLIWNSI